jgi:hypothetical protein
LNGTVFYLLIFFPLLFSFSCGNKEGEETAGKDIFSFHTELKDTDIPDVPVKGFIMGREVSFGYINFERWRGSNDNVINFSVKKPEQQCGFIEGFEGFTLINKKKPIQAGVWKKPGYRDDASGYEAFYKTPEKTSDAAWNCILFIDSFTEKTVTGKIALFFNDGNKSGLAGKFEAVICNN